MWTQPSFSRSLFSLSSLSLIAVLALFPACGGGDDDDPSDAAESDGAPRIDAQEVRLHWPRTLCPRGRRRQ